MANFISRFVEEIGLFTLIRASKDVHILCFQRFIRMFAYGQVTIILALFFSVLGVSADRTGLFMTCTLLGDVIISFVLTLVADKLGRRRILAAGALLMFSSGIVFSYATNFWLLLVAAIVGVISPSGNEIGPFRAVEESTVAHLTDLQDRSDLYAWYSLLGAFGAALGTISCGWIVQKLQDDFNWTARNSYRVIFLIYSVIAIAKFVATLMLSADTELDDASQEQVHKHEPIRQAEQGQSSLNSSSGSRAETYPMRPLSNKSIDSFVIDDDDDVEEEEEEQDREEVLDEMDQFVAAPVKKRSKLLFWVDYLPQISSRSKKIVFQLTILFAIDSFGSGLATSTWISYYFSDRFQVKEGVLGTLFFVTNLVSAASALVASSIAKRLGPIITMVVTHLPSSSILAILGLPSSERVAMLLLVIRSCTASMDVGPRQAFLSSVVSKEERTSVMGFVNVVKTLAQAGAPSLMGKFASVRLMPVGFLVAGLCKVGYDLGILFSFLGTQLHNS
ncbi:major facilitator superfamily domain-containing protein [Lipomyces japonicus]|uniref:major facilitator superfamily domain-containing protein n=1 Tax=Lipomyces japonicus TaxID=56871 RepID=UPI0034CEF532